MIKIEFQDAENGFAVGNVTHPAVPRVGETVLLSRFHGTVASVVWQWMGVDTPRVYVALRKIQND